jgi:hypothetical protein
MALQSGQITVGTSPSAIPVTSTQPYRLVIKNMDNTDDVFIGNGDVSTTTGVRLDKEGRIELSLNPLDRVFVVSAKATHSVGFLAITKA